MVVCVSLAGGVRRAMAANRPRTRAPRSPPNSARSAREGLKIEQAEQGGRGRLDHPAHRPDRQRRRRPSAQRVERRTWSACRSRSTCSMPRARASIRTTSRASSRRLAAVPFIPAGGETEWVQDQISRRQAGQGRGQGRSGGARSAASCPQITVSEPKIEGDPYSGVLAAGDVKNESGQGPRTAAALRDRHPGRQGHRRRPRRDRTFRRNRSRSVQHLLHRRPARRSGRESPGSRLCRGSSSNDDPAATTQVLGKAGGGHAASAARRSPPTSATASTAAKRPGEAADRFRAPRPGWGDDGNQRQPPAGAGIRSRAGPAPPGIRPPQRDYTPPRPRWAGSRGSA
jgi:hypothetical protein